MPWTSSKSGINLGHAIFQHLRPTLIQLVWYFSSLSRRLKNEWDEKVTPYANGSIELVAIADIAPGKNLHLPDLPPGNKPQVDQLKARNKRVLQDAPWTVGLVEAIAAVDVITRQRLDTKNRIALILLDSNFEIGLKEFIVSRVDLFPPHTYNDAKILQVFQRRSNVITEVTEPHHHPLTTIGQGSPLLQHAQQAHPRARNGRYHRRRCRVVPQDHPRRPQHPLQTEIRSLARPRTQRAKP